MQMSVRVTRGYAREIRALQAEEALRQVQILSVLSPGLSDAARRQILDRWQRDASGGEGPALHVLTPDEARARSRVGGG